jgi:hypothetical protein
VIDACHARGVPVAPGCFTPTEILEAHDAGADIVKVFPATTLGPQYIKDVRAPLPQVRLMPTGGVTPENAGDWIRAGAVAVAAGSSLLDSAAIESGRFEVISQRAQVDNVSAAEHMSATVITFGELMLNRAAGVEALLQRSPMLCATPGGGAVAVSLAQFGLDITL